MNPGGGGRSQVLKVRIDLNLNMGHSRGRFTGHDFDQVEIPLILPVRGRNVVLYCVINGTLSIKISTFNEQTNKRTNEQTTLNGSQLLRDCLLALRGRNWCFVNGHCQIEFPTSAQAPKTSSSSRKLDHESIACVILPRQIPSI